MAHGGLPGWLQTVVRAELLAVISVVKYCNQAGTDATVVSDQLHVVTRAKAILCGRPVGPFENDGDLWLVFSVEVQHLHRNGRNVDILHVRSHRDVTDLVEPEIWVCQGNAMADRLAEAALGLLPASTLTAHRLASKKYRQVLQHHEALVAYLIDVGKLAVMTPGERSPPVAPEDVPDLQAIDVQAVASGDRNTVPRHLQWDGLTAWLQWFEQLSCTDSPVVWTSWMELLILFQLTMQIRGVVSIKPKHGRRQWTLVARTQDVGMRKLMQSFACYGTHMIRRRDNKWRAVQVQPHFHGLSTWTTCIPVRLKPSCQRVIRDWWTEQRLGRITTTKQFDDIPVAY